MCRAISSIRRLSQAGFFMNEDANVERQGYRIFIEPFFGLTQLAITALTSWFVWQLIRHDHAHNFVQSFVQNWPMLLKASVAGS